MSSTLIDTMATSVDDKPSWIPDDGSVEFTLIRQEPFDPAVHAEDVEGLPLGLVQHYAKVARCHATVREVDPGVWVATVVGLDGAYGDGDSPDAACDSLEEAIVGWVAVKRRVNATDIPPMEGIDLNPAP